MSAGTGEVIRQWWPIGSALVAVVLVPAFREWLRRSFATREDLNGCGERVTALQTLYVQAREALDAQERQVDACEREVAACKVAQSAQWERIAEHVVRPLERVTESMQEMQEAQAVQTAALQAIHRWFESNAPGAVIPTPTPPRKRGTAR